MQTTTTSELHRASANKDDITAEQPDNVDNDTESCLSSRTHPEAEGSGWITHVTRRSKRIAAKTVPSNTPCEVIATKDRSVAAKRVMSLML